MTIFLEPNEEITSVVDHLIQAKTEEVILVIPIGAQILQSLINLKLLKREADNLKKKIIIITQDSHGQKLVKKAGIETRFAKDEIAGFLNNLTSPIETADLKEFMPSGSQENSLPEDLNILFTPLESHRRSTFLTGFTGSPPKKSPVRVADIIKPSESSFYFPSDRERVFKKIRPEFIEKKAPTLEGRGSDRSVGKEKEVCFNLGWLEWFNFKKIFILLIFLFLTGLFFIGWRILPRAEIILYPKTELFSSELVAQADKNISQIDLGTNKIPGQVVKLERNESREFFSSGEKQVNERARGIITIYNEYSSSPQTLVETTRFVSKDNKLFRLTKTTIVPGAKVEDGKIVANSVEVEVAADEAGEAYNIGPTGFTIPGFQGTPKYNAFYAKSSAAISGGIIGKVKIISQEDFNNAKEILLKDLREKVYQEFKAEIPSEFKLLDSVINESINPVSISPQIGSQALPIGGQVLQIGGQAAKFTLNTKIVLDGLIFKENDLKDVLRKNIQLQITDQKKIIDNSIMIDYKKTRTDFNKGILDLEISVEGKTMAKIDTEKIKSQIRGKNEKEIKALFSSLGEIESLRINFWPFWVKKIPKRLDKIKIII